jgi:hypothetical protein
VYSTIFEILSSKLQRPVTAQRKEITCRDGLGLALAGSLQEGQLWQDSDAFQLDRESHSISSGVYAFGQIECEKKRTTKEVLYAMSMFESCVGL